MPVARSPYVIPGKQGRAASVLERFPVIGAGRSTAENLAAEVNQGLTNRAAARELGLPADTTITKETLDEVRTQAGQAYERVKTVPTKLRPDGQFKQALAAARDRLEVEGFEPDSADKEILNRITALSNLSEASPKVLVAQAKRIRAKAEAAGSRGEREAASILRDLAGEIDQLLERTLPDPKLVTNLQAARQLIARTYNVQDALVGDAVDARALGRQLKRRPLSGGLRDAAQFGQEHPRLARPHVDPQSGNVLAETLLSAGGAIATHNPAGLAAPFLRRGSVALLRRIYERAARENNKDVARHAARMLALRQGSMTGAKLAMFNQSMEALARAGYYLDEE